MTMPPAEVFDIGPVETFLMQRNYILAFKATQWLFCTVLKWCYRNKDESESYLNYINRIYYYSSTKFHRIFRRVEIEQLKKTTPETFDTILLYKLIRLAPADASSSLYSLLMQCNNKRNSLVHEVRMTTVSESYFSEVKPLLEVALDTAADYFGVTSDEKERTGDELDEVLNKIEHGMFTEDICWNIEEIKSVSPGTAPVSHTHKGFSWAEGLFRFRKTRLYQEAVLCVFRCILNWGCYNKHGNQSYLEYIIFLKGNHLSQSVLRKLYCLNELLHLQETNSKNFNASLLYKLIRQVCKPAAASPSWDTLDTLLKQCKEKHNAVAHGLMTVVSESYFTEVKHLLELLDKAADYFRVTSDAKQEIADYLTNFLTLKFQNSALWVTYTNFHPTVVHEIALAVDTSEWKIVLEAEIPAATAILGEMFESTGRQPASVVVDFPDDVPTPATLGSFFDMIVDINKKLYMLLQQQLQQQQQQPELQLIMELLLLLQLQERQLRLELHLRHSLRDFEPCDALLMQLRNSRVLIHFTGCLSTPGHILRLITRQRAELSLALTDVNHDLAKLRDSKMHHLDVRLRFCPMSLDEFSRILSLPRAGLNTMQLHGVPAAKQDWAYLCLRRLTPDSFGYDMVRLTYCGLTEVEMNNLRRRVEQDFPVCSEKGMELWINSGLPALGWSIIGIARDDGFIDINL